MTFPSKVSRSKFGELAVAITPKELRLTAQGCERSELPWVNVRPNHVPQRGFVIGICRLTQPFQGSWALLAFPRLARLRGQPWAMSRNSFGVKTAPFNIKLDLRGSRLE